MEVPLKKYNEDVFTNNDQNSYYLLGCYLTDGCVYKNSFELTSKDKDWLDLIKNIICPDKVLELHNNCYRLRGQNKIIVDWFKQNSCTENKSLTLLFPQIPEKYLPDMIRGIIDGDGSIDSSKNTTYIVSASKSFIDSFSKILINNNIKFNYYERPAGQEIKIRDKISIRKNILYKISIYGKNCYKFLKWIYYQDNITAMPRKQQLAYKIIEVFENRGLSLSNLENFNTDKNRNCKKLSNQYLEQILNKWFLIPIEIRNKIGFRKKFHQENNFNFSYHYMNRLLNGTQRKILFEKIQQSIH
jgi:hypothetical protein